MEYRKLGSSELDVSVFSFGAWQLGDTGYWGTDAQADEDAAGHAAIDAGVNLFDTAEGYGGGESERALGRALGNKRDQVLIASKVSPANCAPEKMCHSCEASLQRLGTDRIDLYQIHWPLRDVPFEAACEQMQRLQQEGKIREIGVSNFGPRDLGAWMAEGSCASNQLGYNIVFRAIEYEIVPACLKDNVGILAYMPLFQGILTGRWRSVDEIPQSRRRTRHFSSGRPGVRHGESGCEDLLSEVLSGIEQVANRLGQPMANVALAWLKAQPGVTSVIIGARNPAQVQRNIEAANLELDKEVLARLDAITSPLKERLGKNADMWCSEPDSRIQ